MNPILSFLHRWMKFLQCFRKRRYGFLDHTSCIIPEGKDPLYLVLSPDLYQISIATLPVSNADEALRYAPSYFTQSDPRIRYGAFRLVDGVYLFSACDPEPIRRRLEESGVNPSSVVRFVLAQEAFGRDSLPLLLEDGSALALSDGVVVRLPAHYVSVPAQNTLETTLQNLLPCLSGFRANMHGRGTPTKKTLMMTALLCGLIALNFILQGIFSYKDAEKIAAEMEQMKSEKQLPPTQMELNALAALWENKENEQIKLRKIIAAFAQLRLENKPTALPPPPLPVPGQNSIVLVPGSNPSEPNLLLIPGDSNATARTVSTVYGEYVASLTYENRGVTFKIQTPTKERAEQVRTTASKILKSNTVTIKDTIVEGSIQ